MFNLPIFIISTGDVFQIFFITGNAPILQTCFEERLWSRSPYLCIIGKFFNDRRVPEVIIPHFLVWRDLVLTL